MNSFYRNYKLMFLILISAIIYSSCKKEEGYGGKAAIKGTIVERLYDRDFTTLQSEKVAIDEDVYIEFGNSNTVGDDTKTSLSGNFEFNYLLPGKYYIYIYSEDSTNKVTDKIKPIIKEINISSSDGTVDIGKIVKYKTIDYDEGFAKVKGVIGGIYFSKNFTYIVGLDYAKDHDVFLYYDNNPTSENKVSTIYNGSYSFTNLIKGKYTLYTYSDNNDNSGIPLVVKKNFEISTLNQVVQMDSITINIEN